MLGHHEESRKAGCSARTAIIKPERQAGQVMGMAGDGSGESDGSSLWGRSVRSDRRDMKKLKTAFKLKFLPTIGEQTEVTDTLKPGWQDMKQKAANELAGVQRHQAS